MCGNGSCHCRRCWRVWRIRLKGDVGQAAYNDRRNPADDGNDHNTLRAGAHHAAVDHFIHYGGTGRVPNEPDNRTADGETGKGDDDDVSATQDPADGGHDRRADQPGRSHFAPV